MYFKNPQEIQDLIDNLELARDEYCQLSIKYIGRDDSVFEKYRKSSVSISTVKALLSVMKREMEEKNEMAS
jgi:hypothetical protein